MLELYFYNECGYSQTVLNCLINLGIDSKGNIYTAEVQGKRIQRFRAVGGL